MCIARKARVGNILNLLRRHPLRYPAHSASEVFDQTRCHADHGNSVMVNQGKTKRTDKIETTNIYKGEQKALYCKLSYLVLP